MSFRLRCVATSFAAILLSSYCVAQTTNAPQTPDVSAPSQTAAPATPTTPEQQAEAAASANQAAANAKKATTDANNAANNAIKATTDANTAVTTLHETVQTDTTDALRTAQNLKGAQESAEDTAKSLQALVNKVNQTRPARSLKAPLGDYVPCTFDASQRYELRAMPTNSDSPLMTAEEVKAIVSSIPQLFSATSKTPSNGAAGTAATAAAAAATKFTDNLNAIKDTLQYLSPDKFVAIILQLATDAGLSDDQIKQLTGFLQQVTAQGTYDRPDDVSCSFSIMQWKETKDNFGRRVANDYIAIEVNLRNLNKQNEFLVHDIQIAVDTGLSPYQFGRFEASRDKQLVRGVVQRGQTEDRRNLIINSLTVAGAILSPVSAAVADAGGTLAVSVSIFQGPFLTGVGKIFPDHTVDYLNNLNDRGFTPSSTNKTVVPVQGSVPLVTFLSEKPLEQLPFVRCGRSRSLNRSTPTLPPGLQADKKDDLNCQLHPYATDVNYDDTLTGTFQKPLRFKDWDGAALNIFKHRVYVVIGGVHIQEVSTDPSVSKVSCPMNTDQTAVDLSKADSSGDISCTISGSNLDQVASIKLEQGKTSVPGTATPDPSGNSATIAFKASAFKTVTGSYDLFLTTKAGKDIDSKQALVFKVPGVAADPTFTPLQGTIKSGQTVTISDTTPGYTIYYTTDGTTPTFPMTGSTQKYIGAITVSKSETIQAIAVATGYTNSDPTKGVYTVEKAPAAPAKAATRTTILGTPSTTADKKITMNINVSGAASSGTNAQMLVGKTATTLNKSGTAVAVAADGTATLTSAVLPAATYVVQAQYLGDATHATSKSPTKTVPVK